MNRRWIGAGVIVLLLATLLVGTAGAQSSDSFSLAWYTLAGGGGRSASTHYAMDPTVGQTAVGWSDNTSYAVSSGYWQNWPTPRVYLPLAVKGA